MTQTPMRRCVYTVLIGQYEKLNEQPLASASTIPFICFTDDPHLHSDTWQIRLITPTFFRDPIRSQRDIKIRPHVYLPDFDASLYIDNAVLLDKLPEHIFERFPLDTPFWLPRHSFRETVLDEFLEVAKLGFDDQNRIFEQLNHYQLQQPDILTALPYWTAILVRDHTAKMVQQASEIWASHVQRYSRRDQLSINMALSQTGCPANAMEIDNNQSDFHQWPIAINRNRKKGIRDTLIATMPLVGQVRELENRQSLYETKFEEAQQERAAMLADISQLKAERDQLRQRFLTFRLKSGWQLFVKEFNRYKSFVSRNF